MVNIYPTSLQKDHHHNNGYRLMELANLINLALTEALPENLLLP